MWHQFDVKIQLQCTHRIRRHPGEIVNSLAKLESVTLLLLYFQRSVTSSISNPLLIACVHHENILSHKYLTTAHDLLKLRLTLEVLLKGGRASWSQLVAGLPRMRKFSHANIKSCNLAAKFPSMCPKY